MISFLKTYGLDKDFKVIRDINSMHFRGWKRVAVYLLTYPNTAAEH